MLVQDPRLSGGSVNPFFPGTEMHPLAKMSKDKCIKYINQQTASVISKVTKDPPAQFVWLSLDLAWNSPYIDGSESEGAVGPSFHPKKDQSSSQCYMTRV